LALAQGTWEVDVTTDTIPKAANVKTAPHFPTRGPITSGKTYNDLLNSPANGVVYPSAGSLQRIP